jgi:hypothetical protein
MSHKNASCNNARYIDNRSLAVPVDLYESVKGDYFIGCADDLVLSDNTSCWVRLYNPYDSCVNLHVNVWTITEWSPDEFRAEFWFNAESPCSYSESENVTCSNTALCPVPTPQVELQFASDIEDEPRCGTMAYIRSGEPGTTVVGSEDGKLIFPPGGLFLIYLSLIGCNGSDTHGRSEPLADEELHGAGSKKGRRTSHASIAFGWWEEPV